VALNAQTNDEPCWINRGMFRDSAGYVLKPPSLLTHPDSDDEFVAPSPIKMRVTIISGHHIPKPEYRSDSSEVIDPYVVVSAERQCFQTPTITDNGFNPKWDCSFDFTIKNPDMAVILFKVMDSEMVGKILGRDDFCAQYAFALSKLKVGYRAIPLEYSDGRLAPLVLFLLFIFLGGRAGFERD